MRGCIRQVGVSVLIASAALLPACGDGHPTNPGSSSAKTAHGSPGRPPAAAASKPRRTPFTTIPAVRPATAPALTASTPFSDRRWSFSDVAIADMDGDGRRDIVAVDEAHGVVVLRQLRAGRWATVRSPGVYRDAARDDEQRHLAVGDVDGDGHPDVVTVAGFERPAITVARGDGRGNLGRARRIRPKGLDSIGADARLADLDGDGRLDLVLATIRSGRQRRPGRGIAVLRGLAGGRFAAATHPTTISSAGRVLVADVNHDGNPDLVVDRALLLGRGGGRFAPSRSLPDPGALGPDLQTVRAGRVIGEWPTEYGARLALLSRDGASEQAIHATSLELDRQGYTPSPENVPSLYSGPGLDAIMPDGNRELLWISRAIGPSGRFTIPIPNVLPFGTWKLAVADLDGDRRTDIVAADDGGRIHVLHNDGPRPLARLLLPATAPFVAADHSVRVSVRCSSGSGSCLGVLRAGSRGRDGGTPVALAAGRTARLRIVLKQHTRPDLLTLRLTSALAASTRVVHVMAQTSAQRGRACTPPIGERVLAGSSRLVVIGSDQSAPIVCDRSTGGQTRFSDDATDSAAAAYGNVVAIIEDICPGGFEGCQLGIAVERFPGRHEITRLQWGTAVGSLAVGRGGALAFLDCDPAGEGVECDPAPGGDIYRFDRRGLKRIADGNDIAVHSLRGSSDGRSFSWIQHGRRHSATWSGRPPRHR
jgi:hypothetical protein